MSRLIDADALDVLTIIGGRMNGKAEFAKAVNEMIQNAPTVDAEPVTRCADCIYFQSSNQYLGFCIRHRIDLKHGRGFCSWGKARIGSD